MITLLDRKDEFLTNFAEVMYSKYLEANYGITRKTRVSYQDSRIKKDLVRWQENEDAGALSKVSLRYIVWDPVTFGKTITAYKSSPAGYSESCTPIAAVNMQLDYSVGESKINLVEINTGGCITRINLNPTITINQNCDGGQNMEYVQSVPATVWTIIHNFGFTPNVWTVNQSGQEIEGVVTPVDENKLTITFSEAVAGTAYLS